MRVGTRHGGVGIVLSSVLCAALALGCAEPPRAHVERGAGLDLPEAWHTWDWARAGRSVIAVPPEEVETLHPQVVELVERAMRERGFRRSARDPDLLVAYRLDVVREVQISQDPGAERSLWGVSLKGSVHVQPNQWRERIYERGRLLIEVMSADDASVVWAGSFKQRARGPFQAHLAQAVAQVLGRFPHASYVPLRPGTRAGTLLAGEPASPSRASQSDR